MTLPCRSQAQEDLDMEKDPGQFYPYIAANQTERDHRYQSELPLYFERSLGTWIFATEGR